MSPVEFVYCYCGIEYDPAFPLRVHVEPIEDFPIDSEPIRELFYSDEGAAAEYYRKITARIRELMKLHDMNAADLARNLLRDDGSKGVSSSYASRLVREPYRISAKQAEAMCNAIDCSIDYLRFDVEWSYDQTVEYGGSDEMGTVYSLLSDEDKRAVWTHAMALLSLHDREEYDLWLSDYKSSAVADVGSD